MFCVLLLGFWRYARLRNPYIPQVCCGFASCASLKLTQFYGFLSLLLSNVYAFAKRVLLIELFWRYACLRNPHIPQVCCGFASCASLKLTQPLYLLNLLNLLKFLNLPNLSTLPKQKETPDPAGQACSNSVLSSTTPPRADHCVLPCGV